MGWGEAMRVVGPVLLAVLALAWGGAAVARPPGDIAVVAATIDDVASLDPAEAYELTGIEVVANLYDRLLLPDPADPQTPAPAAAETVAISEDGRTFTFRLRPGLTFASGNPVTAEDAAWSLRRVLALNKGPAALLKALGIGAETAHERIRATDDRTLAIETGRALAPGFVLATLATWAGAILDRREVLAHARGDDLGNGWLRRASAGSGAFRLTLWRPNEAIVLDRVDTFREGPAAMRRVVLRHVPEPATQRLMLEKGDVDIARGLGPDDLAALRANPALTVTQVLRPTVYYLGLNQRNRHLARPQVRQALRHLIDAQGIADNILKGTRVVHQSFLARGMPGALADAPLGYDPARAKALLAEAGLAEGFAVTMDAHSAAPTADIAQAIQASFAAVGIQVSILPGDGRQTLTRYRARLHDIYIGEWGADILDPHGNAEAFAANPDNADAAADKTLAWRNAWETPITTRLVALALAEPDPARRLARYAELQRMVRADSPFIVLFQDAQPVAMRAGVTFALGPTADSTSYRRIGKPR